MGGTLACSSITSLLFFRLVANWSGRVDRDELIRGGDTIPYIENRAVLALSAGTTRERTQRHLSVL